MPRPRVSVSRAFDELRADYRAGKDSRFVSRLQGVSSVGSGADYHYRSEQQWLHVIERARHYQRNDQIVGQGIRRVVANIVQDGFQLDCDTGAKDADSELKERWQEWSESPDQCHSEGEFCFSEIERLGLSQILVDGDVFVLPLKTGALQIVEAHRCRTPRNTRRNVVHGVLMDDNAKRLQYWFTKEDIGLNATLAKTSDVLPVDARDEDGMKQVLHLYMPERSSQRRGVSVVAPMSETVGMHDDTQFATLVKCQMAAMIAILHERGANWEPLGDQQKGERTQETHGGYTRTVEGVSAALEIFGDVDEKLSAFAPNIPSPEFFPHTMLLLTFIAINLDLPVQVLLLDPSRTNFSSWRGAIDQARLRFKQIQGWYPRKLHTPVYLWWLKRLLSSPEGKTLREAAARESVNIFNHVWNPPTFPYIDPLTDGQADDLQASRCMQSRRRIQASRGRDWDEVSNEIVEDNALLIERALERAGQINAKFPEAGLNWRELVSIPMPDAASTSLMLGKDGEESPAPRSGGVA